MTMFNPPSEPPTSRTRSRQPGPPKLSDVAAKAGVSTATVSRVLNGNLTVDPELAERVKSAARDIGYKSNGPARNLRRRRSDLWALVISDIADPFFTSVARGVEDVARNAGYSVLLCNTDGDMATEARYIDVAAREQVSGVIMSPNQTSTDMSTLEVSGIPLVTIDRSLVGVDAVLVDSRAGAQMATRHLLAGGWTRPACITGPAQTTTAELRASGYRDAMLDAGLESWTRILHAEFRASTARDGAARLLDSHPAPDSFFVANSSMALGVMQELAHRNLRLGYDVGLVAFDDAPWTEFTDPPLTVVAQPAYNIGATSARLLLERIASQSKIPPRSVSLPIELVVRASSKRLQ